MKEDRGEPSYFSQILHMASTETARYWTAPQIIVTIAAPVIGGMLWVVYKPWTGWGPIMQVAVLSVLGFLALWGLVFIFSLVIAPSKLHTQTVELYAIEIQSREQKISERDGAIQKLQEELQRKHPHNEHLEQEVRAALGKLDEREMGFVRWLLDHHRADNTAIHRAGWHGIPNSVVEKTGTFLVDFEREHRGNGLVETNRFHFINPTTLPAVRDALHPL